MEAPAKIYIVPDLTKPGSYYREWITDNSLRRQGVPYLREDTADKIGRRALAAELLGHLDRIASTTAAYHFVRNVCKIELGFEPDSLGAEIDH